jgi:hypothetical protein
MRRILFGTLLLVVAIAAGALSQLGFGGAGPAQIGGSSVSALARTAGGGDALPSTVLAYPFAERNFASRSGAGSRVLRSEGSLTLYAVPGKGGMICLIEVDDFTETAGGACADRNVLLTGPIYMATRREDASRRIVGLVGDGPTYARAGGKHVRVENNAFILEGVLASEVTVGSPSASRTIEIGD